MMEVISVKDAKEFIMANYPNDPLLKHSALTLLDQLPKVRVVEIAAPAEAGNE